MLDRSYSWANETAKIAIIGMGCYYPGANDLQKLWENILARRQQFRETPDARLPLVDYYDLDRKTPDKTYGNQMAVIDGFRFNWAKRRIPKKAFETTDITHWLALEVAIKAFEDAGYTRENIPTDKTGVVLGNTLTGEQSRSLSMRMRWPFVRRSLRESARIKGLLPESLGVLEELMEKLYKSVFPNINEDSLAGNLSNTIAGRICNFFNLDGGGYTVDGACSSSLIAVITACTHLANQQWDIALAGGVDISLDPFELVGFAKAEALTANEMRVYDRQASGFIPGEGSGFVVLKRLEEARAAGDYIYGIIEGWGISSDGKGGLTAPSQIGQAKALRRAYEQASYSSHALDFIEGHGTGTPLGDRTELEGIALALAADGEIAPRSVGVTSFKSIVGHTKAAAGIGGLIKAVMGVNQRVIPPTAGCRELNPVFETTAQAIYPVISGAVRPTSDILRAGVSAMGFGGINAHVTLTSGDPPSVYLKSSLNERALLVSQQETELFVLNAGSIEALIEQIEELYPIAQKMSLAEMADLAVHLTQQLQPSQPIRAAVIAETPKRLGEQLQKLQQILKEQPPSPGEVRTSVPKDLWLGNRVKRNRVAFLFPGQGSQALNMARTLVERHSWAQEFLDQADRWLQDQQLDPISPYIYHDLERAKDQQQIQQWVKALTAAPIASASICLTSLLWQRYLARLGINPVAVGGHSLGELTAFQAAGAYDEKTLLCFAAIRGKATSTSGQPPGTMASLGCDRLTAESLLEGIPSYVVVANINSPSQTVISGELEGITEAISRAERKNILTRQLPVSNAFHSRLMLPSAKVLRDSALIPQQLVSPSVSLFSSVNGQQLQARLELRNHFADQIVAQVDFISMVKAMTSSSDLMIEVGPGKILSDLVKANTTANEPFCLPLESKAGRDRDLNTVLGSYFVLGGDVHWQEVYENRLIRPFVAPQEQVFIQNLCERPFQVSEEEISAIADNQHLVDLKSLLLTNKFQESEDFSTKIDCLKIFPSIDDNADKGIAQQIPVNSQPLSLSLEAILIDLVVQQTEYPRDSITLDAKLLDDLNLDSIKGAELVAAMASQCGVAGQIDPSSLANASLQEILEVFRPLIGEQTNNNYSNNRQQLPKTEIKQNSPQLTTSKASTALTNQPVSLSQVNKTKLPLGDLNPWVRNFVIEYVIEEIPASTNHNVISQTRETEENQELETANLFCEDNWETAKVVIVCEVEETDVAQALSQVLQTKGSQVQIVNFSAMSHEVVQAKSDFSLRQNVKISHFIAIFPRHPQENLSIENRLQKAMARLQSVATPPLASQHQRQYTSVSYVQFGGGYFGKRGQNPQAVIFNQDRQNRKKVRTGSQPLEQSCSVGFAASLHLERADLKVRVIDLSLKLSLSAIAQRIIEEISRPQAYLLVGYDEQLCRRIPRPQVQDRASYSPRNLTWSAEDVFLVTGGAKGITAECALALAEKTGVPMALVGSSSHPEENSPSPRSAEIARTLKRFQEKGLTCHYYSCNIADIESVKTLVARIEQELGQITGVIHGAAINRPQKVEQCPLEEAYQEVTPKILGLLNLMGVLENKAPKLIVGFSSIGSVLGLPGNTWYSFSNEALDLILRCFQQEHPKTAVISLAYSIWADVGMGARMNAVESLARRGIEAISVSEGVSRFVELVENDPGDAQVVIAARLGNLDSLKGNFDTWLTKRTAPPTRLTFLEQIEILEPGVESVIRSHLTLKRDSYVQHHIYKGSYLFPTVFGLEAMAQAVAYTLRKENLLSVRLENIRLERPIVVDPKNGVEIELRTEVLERQSAQEPIRVRAEIRTERTGFALAHFAADFVFGQTKEIPLEKRQLPSTPLDLDPLQDLYSWLLFQGPRFQRLEQIYSLDSRHILFRTQKGIHSSAREKDYLDRADGPFILGDPYYRDSLIHSVQVMIPQDLCLPIGIESLEINQFNAYESESCFGLAINQGQKDRQYNTTVLAMNPQGAVIEKLEGYQVRVLERREDYPTAEEIADPSERDEQRLQSELYRRSPELKVAVPALSLVYLPGLHSLSVEERHQCELPIFEKTLKKQTSQPFQIKWLDSGKPVVEGLKEDSLEISLSHDDQFCLCVADRFLQGCDLAPITHRSQADWLALLGNAREPLMRQLLLSRQAESVDVAGTRIWGALEALRKAINLQNIDLTLSHQVEDSILFVGTAEGYSLSVLTFPIVLTRGAPRIVAVVVKAFNIRPETRDFIPCSTTSRLDQGVQPSDIYRLNIAHDNSKICVVRWPISHKHTANFSKTVYFSQFFAWIDNVRDLAMWPLREALVEELATGNCGMVTNHAQVEIFGEAGLQDILEARIWIGNVSGSANSTVNFYYDWLKLLPNGEFKRIATSKLTMTWVQLSPNFSSEPTALPAFLQNFVEQLHLPDFTLKPVPKSDKMGKKIYQLPTGPHPGLFLHKEIFKTSREDSDAMGNINFATYGIWQGRVLDQFIYKLIPDYYQRTQSQGEFRTWHSEVKYLREAFPFDSIEVIMSLQSISECGMGLRFEYFRITPEGKKQKVAIGEQFTVWLVATEKRTYEPAPLPHRVKEALSNYCDLS